MKYYQLKLGIALLFGLGLINAHAQTMEITETGETQTSYSLNNIHKMSFSSGNLTITLKDDSDSDYALNELEHLIFSDGLVTNLMEDWSNQPQPLNGYPNPVNNTLTIDLNEFSGGKGIVNLQNIDGVTILSEEVNNQSIYSLDVSHLPEGIYICRYSNNEETKAIKITKQ